MGKRKLTRRQFVTTTIAAGAGTIFLEKLVLASPAVPGMRTCRSVPDYKPWKNRNKNNPAWNGNRFQRYNRSSNITRAGVAESLIRQAYEKGIRFFDCADSYGTHPFTASALKEYREINIYSELKNLGQSGWNSGTRTS